MAKAKNGWEVAAAAAAARIEAAHAVGEQLNLLPTEPPTDAVVAGVGGRGRGKSTQGQLRDWLSAKGYRMPEDVLAKVAGLTTREGALVEAMAEAEQVLAWAHGPGGGSPAQRLGVFMSLYAAKVRALDALLPYGLAKVTPDAGGMVVNQIVMPGAQVPQVTPDAAQTARDITPQPRRMAPPPMPHEIQQNQGLADPVSNGSDADIRTEGAKR